MHQVRKHHQGHILTSTGMCSRVQPLTGSMKYQCCTSPSLLARFGTLPLCPLPQNKINLAGCHFVSMKTIQDTAEASKCSRRADVVQGAQRQNPEEDI